MEHFALAPSGVCQLAAGDGIVDRRGPKLVVHLEVGALCPHALRVPVYNTCTIPLLSFTSAGFCSHGQHN